MVTEAYAHRALGRRIANLFGTSGLLHRNLVYNSSSHIPLWYVIFDIIFYHTYSALSKCERIVHTIFNSCNSNSYIYRCIYSHMLLFKCYGLESKLRHSNYSLHDKSCSCKLHHSVLHKSVLHGELFGANS